MSKIYSDVSIQSIFNLRTTVLLCMLHVSLYIVLHYSLSLLLILYATYRIWRVCMQTETDLSCARWIPKLSVGKWKWYVLSTMLFSCSCVLGYVRSRQWLLLSLRLLLLSEQIIDDNDMPIPPSFIVISNPLLLHIITADNGMGCTVQDYQNDIALISDHKYCNKLCLL